MFDGKGAPTATESELSRRRGKRREVPRAASTAAGWQMLARRAAWAMRGPASGLGARAAPSVTRPGSRAHAQQQSAWEIAAPCRATGHGIAEELAPPSMLPEVLRWIIERTIDKRVPLIFEKGHERRRRRARSPSNPFGAATKLRPDLHLGLYLWISHHVVTPGSTTSVATWQRYSRPDGPCGLGTSVGTFMRLRSSVKSRIRRPRRTRPRTTR